MDCPCHTGEQYDDCCGRFITQNSLPESALELMRSRYSAYALNKPGYLITTWHPHFRPKKLKMETNLKWVNFTIIEHATQGGVAQVEFEAQFISEGKVGFLHEQSHFVRQKKRWFYTKGDMLKPTQKSWSPKRNKPCPCGSKLKFKRCCGE